MKLICPLVVYLPRKTKEDKKIFINMNTYRNLNRFTENAAKVAFKNHMEDQLKGKKIDTPVVISYQVFKGSNRKLDKMNVVSIVSKYLLDAITEFECWEDDNDDIVKTEIILPTELDRENPRVEVFISKE